MQTKKSDQDVILHFRVLAKRAEEIKKIVYVLGGVEEETDDDEWAPVPCEDIFSDAHPGVVLRGLRYREELTQKELAEKTGVKQSHISNMENGTRPVSKSMAKRLAMAFNSHYKVFL